MKKSTFILGILCSAILIFSLPAYSLTRLDPAVTTVPMFLTPKSGNPMPAGTIVLENIPYGVLITPSLFGLSFGAHGFHVHTSPSCDNRGLAAGGHFDPQKTGKHLGPYNHRGHLGDLPVLIVAKNGKATLPLLAPRLKVKDFRGRALIVHQGSDNYSDQPKPLGGGGPRVVCGIIK